ncbi:MAG: serine racemase VanT catalytic subunit [Oscillospiraceae bacterium]|jgi:serine/alanine racemase|nr:serine racemase VanT catalytic subunit [Oscillospiraceae bacterium]
MGNKLPKRARAWVEIDLNALVHNLSDIRANIPTNCEVMAVVKANAYGHGDKEIAKRLVSEGVRTFAVATLTEGIRLRKYVPDGDILIIGYTRPQDARFLYKNNLTQLVVDEVHARALNDVGFKICVHIAVDTGMHRQGIESSDMASIERIFKFKNLIIKSVATHHASPDSFDDGEVDFTNKQTERFDALVLKLKEKGYDIGKLHVQSSYGIYNYPKLNYDYVRPGIMLYGVHSQDDDTGIKTNLKPVLSLRAVISQVRRIGAGESVSYSRKYITNKPIKLATVSIGYADGVPRQMSGNGGMCIVNGRKVPIIGRICMDMLMLDVTDAEHVNSGDIATIIGKDGEEVIRCEEVAAASGTITNDILSGLSVRLPRIYI